MSLPIADVLDSAITRLTIAGVEHPEIDAELLAAHVLGESRGRIQSLRLTGTAFTEEDAAVFEALLVRRVSREPLQHITGLAAFRYLELEVGPGVFIPRPETEVVTGFALDELAKLRASRVQRSDFRNEDLVLTVVDLCTGSGAIALAIATEDTNTRVWAVEKSADAYEWAQRNRAKTGAEHVTLMHGDVEDVPSELNGTVSVLVSNPPYIPDHAVPKDVEVRQFDPALALYGGPDGLDVVRRISLVGRWLLEPGGVIVLEHGELQGADIRSILDGDGFDRAETHEDLTGRDRFTVAFQPVA